MEVWVRLTVLAGCLALGGAEYRGSSATWCVTPPCRCDGYGRVICECTTPDEVVIFGTEGALATATQIEVSNCAQVSFLTGALEGLRELRGVHVRDAGLLTLAAGAWRWRPPGPAPSWPSWPGLRLAVVASRVDELPSQAVAGRVDEITVTSSHFRSVRPYAFSNFVGLRSIEISNSTFESIETQCFKKFSLDQLVIRDSKFRSIPSRFASDIQVRNLKLDNVTVDEVRSSAFLITGAETVQLENSNFGTVEGDAFRITSSGTVFVKNNNFEKINSGAFAGFSVPREVTEVDGRVQMRFDNNTVTSFERGALRVDEEAYELMLSDLKFNSLCSCSGETWKVAVSSHDSGVMCAVETPFGNSRAEFKYVRAYEEEKCGKSGVRWAVVGAAGAGLAAALALLGAAVLCLARRVGHSGFTWISKRGSKVPVIVPDGRTYRETELHVIVEKAELLTTDL